MPHENHKNSEQKWMLCEAQEKKAFIRKKKARGIFAIYKFCWVHLAALKFEDVAFQVNNKYEIANSSILIRK